MINKLAPLLQNPNWLASSEMNSSPRAIYPAFPKEWSHSVRLFWVIADHYNFKSPAHLKDNDSPHSGNDSSIWVKLWKVPATHISIIKYLERSSPCSKMWKWHE